MLNNPNALSLLFKKFGIEPKAPSLYVQAFTHVSYSTQHKNNINYERLEFLGDAVLDKLISAFLYREYPDMTSGELSTTHSLMTKGKTLTIAAERLGFKDLIIIGGTMRSNDDISPRILEDVFEAFIGAVFLDQGEAKVWLILKQTIIHYYLTNMLNKDQDYKTLLNTYFLQHRDVSFKYVSTFDRISRKYTVELVINKHKASVGKGDKIKDAENAAAKIIYLRFKKLNKL